MVADGPLPLSHQAWVYALLQEANFDPWESVESAYHRALACSPDTPGQALAVLRLQHITETKRMYWGVIAGALGLNLAVPHALPGLLRWELEAATGLSEQQLARNLEYGGRTFSVAGLLRFSARHSVWHAGQAAQALGAAAAGAAEYGTMAPAPEFLYNT
ncbi:hypothetical protein ACFP81_02935 [Deinococcus lacus]|uniref:DinB-like domain-containing protein n=1 Tax=Deinococcus lacus TaxID=392561 RepID=A0ABW1YC75_9DEIO